MDENHGEVQVFAADQGLLVWGPSKALEIFDGAEDVRARALKPSTLAKLGMVATGILAHAHAQDQAAAEQAAQAAAEAGRYLRLSDESWAFVQEHGISNLTAGVVRLKDVPGAEGGEILKHLQFIQGAPVGAAAGGPAALTLALANVATQSSIQAQLEEIQEYLEVIDKKLDRLLKDRRLEIAGQLGGVVFAIEEAEAVQESTGGISALTWSKVQQNALLLQQVQAEAVTRLADVADRVIGTQDDVDELAKTAVAAEEDVQFWLGMLARSMALQDRQQLLELARVEQEDPAQLEAHRTGLVAARALRHERIVEALRRINEATVDAGSLTNLGIVANPISSRRVRRGVDSVTEQVVEFVTHTEIELAEIGRVEARGWLQAAQGLAGDVRTSVEGNAADAARGVARLGRAVQARNEDRAVERARRILARREAAARQELQDGEG